MSSLENFYKCIHQCNNYHSQDLEHFFLQKNPLMHLCGLSHLWPSGPEPLICSFCLRLVLPFLGFHINRIIQISMVFLSSLKNCGKIGVPEWLSRLRVHLLFRLRSWSQGHETEPHMGLCIQWGGCLRILPLIVCARGREHGARGRAPEIMTWA